VYDPMTMLKADHRELIGLLTVLGDSNEGLEREALTMQVQRSLELHLSVEEELLHPLVAEELGIADEEEAAAEHDLVREGLARVVELVAKPGYGTAIEMLKAAIAHHVAEEEGEHFPELKKVLGREDWIELGDQMADARAEAGIALPTYSPRRSARRSGTQSVFPT